MNSAIFYFIYCNNIIPFSKMEFSGRTSNDKVIGVIIPYENILTDIRVQLQYLYFLELDSS